MRDLIFDAARNESRLFLSHITSTTHHPWGTPDGFPKKQYFGRTSSFSSSHEDTNDYLNAVAYVDNWLGQILKYIDEAGIIDKTLVVFVGDQYVKVLSSSLIDASSA
jgi:phosphoglycerol transferase MdoB-like AlkP superfamily enzyme